MGRREYYYWVVVGHSGGDGPLVEGLENDDGCRLFLCHFVHYSHCNVDHHVDIHRLSVHRVSLHKNDGSLLFCRCRHGTTALDCLYDRDGGDYENDSDCGCGDDLVWRRGGRPLDGEGGDGDGRQ